MTKVFLTDYRMKLARQRDRVTHSLSVIRWNLIDPLTKEATKRLNPDLNQQIVNRGLKLLVQQLERAREVTNNRPYSGQFEAIHSIPCYHTLCDLSALSLTVTKHHFHRHWHFESDTSIPLPPPSAPSATPIIFPPDKVVTKGRRRQDRTTRHDPSAFELSAGPLPAPRPGRIGGETSYTQSTSTASAAASASAHPPLPTASAAASASAHPPLPTASAPTSAPPPTAQQEGEAMAQQARQPLNLALHQEQEQETQEGQDNQPAAPPRKRGRPKGSKDKQPRRKKVRQA